MVHILWYELDCYKDFQNEYDTVSGSLKGFMILSDINIEYGQLMLSKDPFSSLTQAYSILQ